jgi:tetratricopeptide (TPR) repeat protein
VGGHLVLSGESRKNASFGALMAQPATNPKIEELRARLKADPKSRLFYPLAEELRKSGQVAEAEQVLRGGITAHATYLSAWVSLGRVLRDQKKDGEAVEALSHALQLDPGNVVAARLLADAHLALGDKVEAIKKYKLVYALLPADEDLENMIAELEKEIGAPPPAPSPDASASATPFAEPPPQSATTEVIDFGRPSAPDAAQPLSPEPTIEAAEPPPAAPEIHDSPFHDQTMDTPFAEAMRSSHEDAREGVATGDAEPMRAEHEESPFEEPIAQYSSAAFEVDAPAGMHEASAPLGAEVPSPWSDDAPPVETALPFADEPLESPADEADVFSPAPATTSMEPEPFGAEEDLASPPAPAEEPTNTATMADLYVKQGLISEARHIYENILARDPDNHEVRAKLEALSVSPHTSNAKIAALEKWLTKVGGREVGHV